MPNYGEKYCNSDECAQDYGQEQDSEGTWWCGECGYETYDWSGED